MQSVPRVGHPEFRQEEYRGRSIAVLHRHGRWHVYLDHVLQHNVLFATAEDAVVWLAERIDQGFPARLH
jgi:hypothetical protein